MNTTESEEHDEHAWFNDRIGAYLSGGMDAEERGRLESHAQSCSECASELERMRQLEGQMSEAFAGMIPAADFESRLVGGLRRRRNFGGLRTYPWARKAAVAAAAAVVVGGIGYVGREYIAKNRLPTIALLGESSKRGKSSSNLRQIGEALPSSSRDYETTLASSGEQNGPREEEASGRAPAAAGNRSDSSRYAKEGTGQEYFYRLGDFASGGHNEDDKTKVLTGDGRVNSQSNPYGGVQRDMIVTGTGGVLTLGGANAFGALPIVSGKGVTLQNGVQVEQPRFKPTQLVLTTNGKVVPDDTLAQLGPHPAVSKNAPPALADSDGNSVADLPGGAPATQPAGVGDAQGQATAPAPGQTRKVIREGVMEFEVDTYDSAFMTISKIVTEEGGFVAAADSDKLPNGKVKGTVTVRVPPDHLDTLVLKLRALGDLKSQRLGSKDVSKDYTDLESELRAARAMEERLLDMIKNAKGKVSELLEAEKELGNWRTRIEKIQGTLNYYNNLVSMATLTVTAYERDIKTPASASQTEETNTGVETDDVEHARAETIKAIDAAKGRIIESTLQQLEAGQLAAKVVAEVPPDNAGPILDRLKQLGRVARLDIQRKQVTDPAKPQADGRTPARIETAPTRVIVSMYNLANVAPRLTTNLNLAGQDVEAVYHTILKRVGDANGRVLSSNLSRQDATQAGASIQFEVKSVDADALLNDIRTKSAVQVLALNVTENPDTANVTTAKQAFTVQIIPSSQVAPREMRTLLVQTSEVEAAMQSLSAAAGSSGGRVIETALTQDGSGRSVGRLAVEVPLDKADQFVDQAKQRGKVRTAEATKNSQVPEGPLSRARINLVIDSGESIVQNEAGLWSSVRDGLSTSVRGLLWSLELIIIGLCLVAPWALMIWGGWKLARRRKQAYQRQEIHPLAT